MPHGDPLTPAAANPTVAERASIPFLDASFVPYPESPMQSTAHPRRRPFGGAAAVGAALAFLLVPLLSAPEAQAQGTSVEFTEVSELQMAGFLGALLARQAGGESVHTIHVLDTKMRSDVDDASTIFDAEAAEWHILYHDMEAYQSFGLADFREMGDELRRAREEAEAELEAHEAEMEANREAMEEARREMDVSVDYRDMGERETINGFAADRHQVIVRVEDAGDVEGAEEVEGGALVLVLDMWLSEELARQNPLYAGHGDGADNPFVQALMNNPEYQEWMEEFSSSMEPGNPGGELTLFAMVDPRVGAAMDEALTELAQLDGMAVRTTSVVALLPPQAELDTDVLIAWRPDSMGDRIQGEASDAAREAAVDAARSAVRGLTRGLLGRGGGDDEEEAEIDEEELVIQPLLRYTTEVTGVRTTGTPTPDMFFVPEGYQDFSAMLRQTSAGGGSDR
jgi:hypothetical protein